MKKISSLIIGCSLALAVSALAQQGDPTATPPPKKHPHPANNAAPAAQEAPAARHPQAPHAQAPMPAHAQPHAAAAHAQDGAQPNAPTATAEKTRASQRAARQARNREKAQAASPNAETNAAPAKAETNAAVATNNPPNSPPDNKANKAKKPDQATVAKIKSQHANFHAQAKPQQVPSVTYNQNYRITNSQSWQGEQYNAFRSYHPVRHDQGWYHSHYNRIVLIGGGYYFFNAGYWYPAWGYQPTAQYYAYDGPIYAGREAEPPDQVIANVQASLQDMGYYKGEVDGLLGPLTREALTSYQADNGLYTTAAIDEPTLDALGMGS